MSAEKASHSKRAEIIQVASKLFYEQGYHRTGIQQIIDAAGTAKGTFYTHFKSKDELGLAWLKARHTEWNRWLHDYLKQADSAHDKLLAAFDFLGEWMPACDYRGCAFLNTLSEIPDPDNPLRFEIARHKQELLRLFADLIAAHLPEETAAVHEQKARILFLLFEGTLIEIQNFRELWPLDCVRRQLESLL